MYLKPGKRSAVKICLKCIFGVKSAKKNFFLIKILGSALILRVGWETGNTKFIPSGLSSSEYLFTTSFFFFDKGKYYGNEKLELKTPHFSVADMVCLCVNFSLAFCAQIGLILSTCVFFF